LPTFLFATVFLNLSQAVYTGFQLETIQAFFEALAAMAAIEALSSDDPLATLATGSRRRHGRHGQARRFGCRRRLRLDPASVRTTPIHPPDYIARRHRNTNRRHIALHDPLGCMAISPISAARYRTLRHRHTDGFRCDLEGAGCAGGHWFSISFSGQEKHRRDADATFFHDRLVCN